MSTDRSNFKISIITVLFTIALVLTQSLVGSTLGVAGEFAETYSSRRPVSINTDALTPTPPPPDELTIETNVSIEETLILPELDYNTLETPLSDKKRQTIGIHRRLPTEALANNWRLIAQTKDKFIWRNIIRAPNAQFIRPHFSNLGSAQNQQIYLYGTEGTPSLQGPFNSANPSHNDTWAAPIDGEVLFIQVIQQGPAAQNPPTIIIDKINHGFIHPLSGTQHDPKLAKLLKNTGTCYLDITCDTTWDELGTAVARMIFEEENYSYVCTGSVIQDQNNTYKNWFLTANHCINSQTVANTLIAYFNYRTTSCNGSIPSLSSLPKTQGATYKIGKSDSSSSDFTLLELNQSPPAGTLYLGWTTTDLTAGQSVVGIHHPAGTQQRISYGNENHATSIGTNFWGVRWTQSSTEGGSSGSPLFNTNTAQVVGTLNSGTSSCSNMQGSDFYGKFGVSWENGLKDYLGSTVVTNPITYTFTPKDTLAYRGEKLGPINVTLTNNTNAALTYKIKTFKIMPTGKTIFLTPLLTRSLTANESRKNRLFLTISNTDPIGKYTYGVEIYDQNNNKLLTSSFSYKVL
ncbi:MAG: trypsin-like peptidase domain-containing protein [Magnetococcus sp. DMHC-6]